MRSRFGLRYGRTSKSDNAFVQFPFSPPRRRPRRQPCDPAPSHQTRIDYDENPWPAKYPRIEDVGGKPDLLQGVETAVRLSNGRSIGFVLDANSSIQNSWNAVSARLREVGMAVPNAIPEDGFVGEALSYRARVGVWLMPDNQRDGTLENFLRELVRGGDLLLPYAEEAAGHAKDELGAGFSANDVDKAVLHTWLAWQEEPGLPYGTAVRARFFRDDSPAAQAFVREALKIQPEARDLPGSR